MEPSSSRLYRTYVSHPWIVRELSTGARMMLSGAAAAVGMPEEAAVDITDPPQLAWRVTAWGQGQARGRPGSSAWPYFPKAKRALRLHVLRTQRRMVHLAVQGRFACAHGLAVSPTSNPCPSRPTLPTQTPKPQLR